jgi:acetyl-CoA synthetase
VIEGVPSYLILVVWEIIEKHKVTNSYCANSHSRFKRECGICSKTSFKTLKVIGSVGEPINEEACTGIMTMYQKKCPVVDTCGKTETGGIISPIAFVTPTKPTYATLPLPGIQY